MKQHNLGIDNRDTVLEMIPHYANHQSRRPRTVFCSEPDRLEDDGFGNPFVPGCRYHFSEVIYKLNRRKAVQAHVATKEEGHRFGTVRWYEAFLRYYYGKEVTLVHILAGVSYTNGEPYHRFGTKDPSPEGKED